MLLMKIWFSSLFVLSAALVLLDLGAMQVTQCVEQAPEVVLWSWEHKDDLSFIDRHKVAVACYAGTIVLGRDVATLKKRLNQLILPGDVFKFPVFRLENAHSNESPGRASFRSAVDLIAKYLAAEHFWQVQIDYDATVSDRKEYLRFLQELRTRLPGKTVISITALGSWCLDDKWLQDAPVDEVVAMMFSMGRGKDEALSILRREHLDSGSCSRQSLGLSINEPGTRREVLQLVGRRDTSRLYLFSSSVWTKQNYQELVAEVTK